MFSLFQKFTAFHHSLTSPSWLRSSRDWRFQLGAVVLILLAAMINFDLRDTQWENWKSQPGVYFVDETPMVSTTDAAYFLSFARDYQDGARVGTFSSSRLYPEYTPGYQARVNPDDYTPHNDRPVSAFDIPLLSVIITHVAEAFTDGNLVLAGNLIIPYSLFLTAVAVGVMFWIAGHPAEGAIASLGVGMSAGFMIRTSIGRIDTDQLFIFFIALCLSFVLLASRERNLARMLAFVLLTALSSSVAYWWHQNELFIVVVPVVMAFSILISQLSFKRAVLAFIAFTIAINPVVMLAKFTSLGTVVIGRLTGVSFSAQSSYPESPLIFPNTFTTITELERLDILGTLATMTPHPALGIIGAIGFLVWVFLYPRKGIIFLPFFVLGLLAVVAGRRFAFFASPFVWFGLAWLFMCLSRGVARGLSRKSPASSFSADGTTLALAAAGLFATAVISATEFTPRPSFSAATTRSFAAIAPIAGNDGGILTTWWDYGYYAHFHSGLDTFHDGGLQQGPRTHLLARGLTSSNPDELIQITKFVTLNGGDGIARNATSLRSLNEAIARSGMPDKPVYLVLTRQMGNWMGSIASLGRFNVMTGKEPGRDVIDQYAAPELVCKRIKDARFQCRRGLLDLDHGTLDGKPVISEIILTRDGFPYKKDVKNNKSPWMLIIQRMPNGGNRFVMMHRNNWNSNFSKLFNLGVYNPKRLELVLDHYPEARVYRILQ